MIFLHILKNTCNGEKNTPAKIFGLVDKQFLTNLSREIDFMILHAP